MEYATRVRPPTALPRATPSRPSFLDEPLALSGGSHGDGGANGWDAGSFRSDASSFLGGAHGPRLVPEESRAAPPQPWHGGGAGVSGGPMARGDAARQAAVRASLPPPRPSSGRPASPNRSPTASSPRRRHAEPPRRLHGQQRHGDGPTASAAAGVWVGASRAGPLPEWRVQHVVAWLGGEMGMPEHGGTFGRAQIDGLTLPHLDVNALRELGVTAQSQQAQLLAAVRQLAAASRPQTAGLSPAARRVRSWTTSQVCSWLEEVVGLPRYVQAWSAAAIDGTVLLCLDRPSLVELGVSSALHRSLLLAEAEVRLVSTPSKSAFVDAEAECWCACSGSVAS